MTEQQIEKKPEDSTASNSTRLLNAPYSQGIMGDGPVILHAGEPMTPEEIVKTLNDKSYTIGFLMNVFDIYKNKQMEVPDFDTAEEFVQWSRGI